VGRRFTIQEVVNPIDETHAAHGGIIKRIVSAYPCVARTFNIKSADKIAFRVAHGIVHTGQGVMTSAPALGEFKRVSARSGRERSRNSDR
jgi:hypothetical protein